MKSRWFVALVVLVAVVLVPLSCKKNQAPNVPTLSGPSSGRYGDTLSFSVSATDPDKDEVSFSIEWGDGTPADWVGPFQSGVGNPVKHVFADSGVYAMRVKAKDAKEMESEWSDYDTIRIGFALAAKPTTPAGPATGDEGVFYTFTTTATSSSGESLLVQFDFGDTLGNWVGPFASGSAASDSHAFSVADTYVVKAKAKLSSGGESGWSDGYTIVISIGAPAVPGAPGGPASLYASVSADFKVATTARSGGDVKYVFDWADGTVETTAATYRSGDTATLGHLWSAAGAYAVKARAFLVLYPAKISGWSAPLGVTVMANSRPAAPAITVPGSAVPGVFAFFTARTVDPDADSVSYRFDFGDAMGDWSGLVPSGTVVNDSHAYLRADTVYVKCKARDAKGAESGWSDSAEVVVEPSGLVAWYWWKNNAVREPGITSPVLVNAGGEDILYFGGRDGQFYGVDMRGTTQSTGSSVFFGDTFTGHPAFAAATNHIIVGNTDGELYAFDLSLNKAWHWPGKTPDSLTRVAWGTPAINGDKIYVGHDDDSLFLFQDNGSTCSRIAAYYVGAGIVDAPVIDADGNVVFGTDAGDLYKLTGDLTSVNWRAPLETGARIHGPAIGSDGTIYCGSSSGHVFAVNPADGSVKWPANVEGEAWRPVVGAGAVFVGSGSGKVYSLNVVTGAKNWEKQLGSAVVASPILTIGGYLYCQDSSDVLYCLRQASGATVWACDCPSFLPPSRDRGFVLNRFKPSPTIDAGGNLFIVGKAAVYYVSGLRGETIANTPWPKWQHDVYNSGH
jgi:outer membrane protein assembly factor BamB